MIPPVMIDPKEVREVEVELDRVIVLNVDEPGGWSASIADPSLVRFQEGGDRGGWIANPGLCPLSPGRTEVVLSAPDGTQHRLRVIVTAPLG